MGRTHQRLTYQQEQKLHSCNHISHVKGIHPTGGWLGPSTRSSVHVDMESDGEDDSEENVFYERILHVFQNGISDKDFTNSFSDALHHGKDVYVLADLMLSYFERIVSEENRMNVPSFGNMSEFDSFEFYEYVIHYFEFMSPIIKDIWMDNYSISE
jgi:hypothetical protein